MTVIDDEHNQEVEKDRSVEAAMPRWSPAQIVGLVVGIGFIVLGVGALAKTGFDTDHIYRPTAVVWHMQHSPLFGAIEVGFGVLMVLASVIPGGSRTLLAFLGAISLAFGLVLLGESVPNRLNDWLGVTHRNGWLFAIVGGVVLLAALLAPVFGGHVHRHVTRTTSQVGA